MLHQIGQCPPAGNGRLSRDAVKPSVSQVWTPLVWNPFTNPTNPLGIRMVQSFSIEAVFGDWTPSVFPGNTQLPEF